MNKTIKEGEARVNVEYETEFKDTAKDMFQAFVLFEVSKKVMIIKSNFK